MGFLFFSRNKKTSEHDSEDPIIIPISQPEPPRGPLTIEEIEDMFKGGVEKWHEGTAEYKKLMASEGKQYYEIIDNVILETWLLYGIRKKPSFIEYIDRMAKNGVDFNDEDINEKMNAVFTKCFQPDVLNCDDMYLATKEFYAIGTEHFKAYVDAISLLSEEEKLDEYFENRVLNGAEIREICKLYEGRKLVPDEIGSWDEVWAYDVMVPDALVYPDGSFIDYDDLCKTERYWFDNFPRIINNRSVRNVGRR